MTPHQAALFTNACRALETARLNLDDGDTKAANLRRQVPVTICKGSRLVAHF
jgi:hypothetical protein